MSRAFLITGLFAAVLPGCTGDLATADLQPCNLSKDCTVGVCLDGTCHTGIECATSGDCDAGQVCNPTHECVAQGPGPVTTAAGGQNLPALGAAPATTLESASFRLQSGYLAPVRSQVTSSASFRLRATLVSTPRAP